MSNKKVTMSADGVAIYGPCDILGIYIGGMDGTNDSTVSFYDNTSGSGDEVIPTATYDASALGLNGVTCPQDGIPCQNGLYIDITSSGTTEVIIIFK